MESFINSLAMLLPIAVMASWLAVLAWAIWVTRSIRELQHKKKR